MSTQFITEEPEQFEARQRDTPVEEPSPMWLVAFGGLALAAIAAFVIFETLSIFSAGSAQYVECVRGSGVPLEACGDSLDLAYDYRYGIDALSALGAALLVAFMGPLPMIALLSRYRNNIVGAILFFLIMFPYGMLAFLVLVIGALVVVFYGVELT